MGMDSLRDLHTWYKPDWLVQHCELVVLNRPGVEEIWIAVETRFPGIRDRIHLVEMPGVDLSGTNIRARIDAGRTDSGTWSHSRCTTTSRNTPCMFLKIVNPAP